MEDFDGSIEKFLRNEQYTEINSTRPSSLFESIEAVDPEGIRSEEKDCEPIASREMS